MLPLTDICINPSGSEQAPSRQCGAGEYCACCLPHCAAKYCLNVLVLARCPGQQRITGSTRRCWALTVSCISSPQNGWQVPYVHVFVRKVRAPICSSSQVSTTIAPPPFSATVDEASSSPTSRTPTQFYTYRGFRWLQSRPLPLRHLLSL